MQLGLMRGGGNSFIRRGGRPEGGRRDDILVRGAENLDNRNWSECGQRCLRGREAKLRAGRETTGLKKKRALRQGGSNKGRGTQGKKGARGAVRVESETHPFMLLGRYRRMEKNALEKRRRWRRGTVTGGKMVIGRGTGPKGLIQHRCHLKGGRGYGMQGWMGLSLGEAGNVHEGRM